MSMTDDMANLLGKQPKQFAQRVLASMGRRAAAYFLDGMVIAAVAFIVFSLAWLLIRSRYQNDWVVGIWAGPFGLTASMLLVMLADIVIFFAASLVTALQVWLTNGYTVGKWLVHIRIKRTDGQKISLITALVREVLVKGVCNGLLQGLLNVFSLLWATMASGHRTMQDWAAGTEVVLTLPLYEE